MTHTCWNFSSYPHFRNCSFLTIHRIFRLKTTLGKHPFHISCQLGPILILIAPAYWRLYSVDFPDPVFFRISPFLSTITVTLIRPYPWIFGSVNEHALREKIQSKETYTNDAMPRVGFCLKVALGDGPAFWIFSGFTDKIYINWWFSWPNSFFVRFDPSKKFILDNLNIITAH